MRRLLLLVLIAGCTNSPTDVGTKPKKDNSDTASIGSRKKENKTACKSLKEALFNPGNVDSLIISPEGLKDGYETKHLSADISKLTNLKVLEIHCLENLEDLPPEIGNLKSLEILDMDEGNGCTMNVSIPTSIGNLTNLKELILDGALDAEGIRRFDSDKVSSVQLKMKELPQTIVKLQNLEVLDLGRNGLKEIPAQVFSLKKLKILKLYFNDIDELPSSISNLISLEELYMSSDAMSVRLPESIKTFKRLKLFLGEAPEGPSHSEVLARKKLQEEFPNITFSYNFLD